MTDKFKFEEEDKKLAKSFFTAADKLLKVALEDPDTKLGPKFQANGEIKRECISDAYIIEHTLDANGKPVEKERPIIDLVQQGGGMWGIALLGYCYILEKVGIRFFSHGGTSAGAINALFLSSISAEIYQQKSLLYPEKKGFASSKSELLTLIVSQMDFSSFIDSKGIAKWIQMKLFKSVNSSKLQLLIGFSLLALLVSVYFGVSYYLRKFGLTGITDVSYFSFILGTVNIIALVVLLYVLVIKKLGENFGLNTGDKFLDWVKGHLETLGINTTEDLYGNLRKTKMVRDPKVQNKIPGIRNHISGVKGSAAPTGKSSPIVYSVSNVQGNTANTANATLEKKLEYPKVIFITANLTHKKIVRFPKQASMYWKNYLQVHPAAYVRASMSLPFIFETFIPNLKTHVQDQDSANSIKYEVRMVDGGMLSNFPIRDFHRTGGGTPSFPTFGILLSERYKIASEKHMEGKKNTLFRFIGSFISTFRNFYDNDYLSNQEEIDMLIETVDTLRPGSKNTHINWLDFAMPDTDKKLLFERGAEAAIRQLVKFKWESYQELR